MFKQINLLKLLALCILLVSCNNGLVTNDTQPYKNNRLLSQTPNPRFESSTVKPQGAVPTLTETPFSELSGDSSETTLTPTGITSQETTEVVPANKFGLYHFSPWVGYWVEYLPAESFPYERKYISEFSSLANEFEPGNADLLSFAHFSDKISYWVSENKEGNIIGYLIIADMIYTNSKQVYSDKEHPYGDVLGGNLRLIWTPDDQHIIVDASNSDQPSKIYHVATDTTETWPFNCDSIAISPKSGLHAIWCESVNANNYFAVVEWGGDIWFSDNPPTDYLIESSERVESPWAWSADGEYVAFFDESTFEANLTIVDRGAHLEKTFPYSAYWLSESYLKIYSDTNYIFSPIKWSENGQYLLIYAKGSEQSPCPLGEKGVIEDVKIVEQACWQVINADTGEVVWPTQDKPYETFLNLPEMIKTVQLGDAAITPDGSYIAIEYWYASQNNLLVISLEQGAAQNIEVLGSYTMRWGR